MALGAWWTNRRAPAGFLSRSWRNGTGGAIAMGVHYGGNCVGCCWGSSSSSA
ncbi:MAG: copper chaperone [Thermohalobaculum sp.]